MIAGQTHHIHSYTTHEFGRFTIDPAPNFHGNEIDAQNSTSKIGDLKIQHQKMLILNHGKVS